MPVARPVLRGSPRAPSRPSRRSCAMAHRAVQCYTYCPVSHMPTLNPRVNVTLSPSTDSLVSRLSRLQGCSKSQVLRELLEAAEPALQRAAALMEAASGAHRQVLDGLALSLDKAQARVEAALAGHLREADQLTADLVVQAQAVRGRRPGRTAAAARPGRGSGAGKLGNPPASNRGVKSSKAGTSRATTGRRK